MPENAEYRKNFIYIPVLVTGVTVSGLILGRALEKQETQTSLPNTDTLIDRKTNTNNCSVGTSENELSTSIGTKSKQFLNFKRTIESLSSEPELKIDLDNGIPSIWALDDPGNWYAKPMFVNEGDMHELRVAINYSRFGQNFTQEDCTIAKRQLKQAISIYQLLQNTSFQK